jgi:hypothetical protein
MASNVQVTLSKWGSTGWQIVISTSPGMEVAGSWPQFEQFESNFFRIQRRIAERMHFVDARRTRS